MLIKGKYVKSYKNYQDATEAARERELEYNNDEDEFEEDSMDKFDKWYDEQKDDAASRMQ